MAKARARTQARKVKDKWKAKQWYTVLAPPMFNKAVVAETLADDPQKLVGRVVATTLQDLTGDFKQMHIKLRFQVDEVQGSNASSKFVGHSLTSDYVRRMIRRNHSKISAVYDVQTKDGALVRVKPFAVTERRSQGSQQAEVRRIMGKTLTDLASATTLAGLVKQIIDGDVNTAVYRNCRKLYPLRRVEVNKTELRTPPSVVLDDDVSAISAPGEDEPPAEEEGTTQADELEASTEEASAEAGEEPEAETEEATESEEPSSEEEAPAEEEPATPAAKADA